MGNGKEGSWERKAEVRHIFLIDKENDYSEITKRISKIMSRQEFPSSHVKPKRILTKTEESMIRLASEGLTQKEIGERLRISHRTVQAHFSNIANKLGTQTQIHSFARAIALGMIIVNYEFSEEFCIIDDSEE